MARKFQQIKPDAGKQPRKKKPEEPARRSVQYPQIMKKRAYELYMQVNACCEHLYTQARMTSILVEEFGNTVDLTSFDNSYVAKWAEYYGWKEEFIEAQAKGLSVVVDELTQKDKYDIEAEARGARCEIKMQMAELRNDMDFYSRVRYDSAMMSAAFIAQLLTLTNEHYKSLMLRRRMIDDPETGEPIYGYVYEVGKNQERKQVFDMYMQGVAELRKMLGVVQQVTRTTATMSSDGKELNVDTIAQNVAELNPNSHELIMKLFGVEQAKGGMGNDLSGPVNAEFPTEQGDPRFIPVSTEGIDPEGEGH